MITEERFEELMEVEHEWQSDQGDTALKGLLIMSKYVSHESERLIEGADHDVIYGLQVSDLVEAGITEEDVRALNKLNWFIEDEGLQHFV